MANTKHEILSSKAHLERNCSDERDTGIGKLVNTLRKRDGIIGQKAKALVSGWKIIVSQQITEQMYNTCQSDAEEHPPASGDEAEEDEAVQSENGSVESEEEINESNHGASDEEHSDHPDDGSDSETDESRLRLQESVKNRYYDKEKADYRNKVCDSKPSHSSDKSNRHSHSKNSDNLDRHSHKKTGKDSDTHSHRKTNEYLKAHSHSKSHENFDRNSQSKTNEISNKHSHSKPTGSEITNRHTHSKTSENSDRHSHSKTIVNSDRHSHGKITEVTKSHSHSTPIEITKGHSHSKIIENSAKHSHSKASDSSARHSHSKTSDSSARHSHSKTNDNSNKHSHSKSNENLDVHSNSESNENLDRHSHSKSNENLDRHSHSKSNENLDRHSHSKSNENLDRHSHNHKDKKSEQRGSKNSEQSDKHSRRENNATSDKSPSYRHSGDTTRKQGHSERGDTSSKGAHGSKAHIDVTHQDFKQSSSRSSDSKSSVRSEHHQSNSKAHRTYETETMTETDKTHSGHDIAATKLREDRSKHDSNSKVKRLDNDGTLKTVMSSKTSSTTKTSSRSREGIIDNNSGSDSDVSTDRQSHRAASLDKDDSDSYSASKHHSDKEHKSSQAKSRDYRSKTHHENSKDDREFKRTDKIQRSHPDKSNADDKKRRHDKESRHHNSKHTESHLSDHDKHGHHSERGHHSNREKYKGRDSPAELQAGNSDTEDEQSEKDNIFSKYMSHDHAMSESDSEPDIAARKAREKHKGESSRSTMTSSKSDKHRSDRVREDHGRDDHGKEKGSSSHRTNHEHKSVIKQDKGECDNWFRYVIEVKGISSSSSSKKDEKDKPNDGTLSKINMPESKSLRKKTSPNKRKDFKAKRLAVMNCLDEDNMSFNDFLNFDEVLVSKVVKKRKPNAASSKVGYKREVLTAVSDKASVVAAPSMPSPKAHIPLRDPQAGQRSVSPAERSEKNSNKRRLGDETDTEISVPSPPAKQIKLTQEDIMGYLETPSPQPGYKPRHFREPDDSKKNRGLDTLELMAMNAKSHIRTQVYSGRKNTGMTQMMSLYDLCMRVLMDNIDSLEYVGGVPYDILQPVLERCSAEQLYRLEELNTHFVESTGHLWEAHCTKDFRSAKREEMETWRELYLRKFEERESKLEKLRANIAASEEARKAPVKHTKLAYIDSVAKAPRDVRRQQVKYGTATVSKVMPVGNRQTPGGYQRPKPSPFDKFAQPVRPHKAAKVAAPMMQRTLQMMKKFHRR